MQSTLPSSRYPTSYPINYPTDIQAEKSKQSTSACVEKTAEKAQPEIVHITVLAMTIKTMQTESEIIQACQRFLGHDVSQPQEVTSFDSAKFEQRKTDLLELALEFYIHKNKAAAAAIAAGISACYPSTTSLDEEIEFYKSPDSEHGVNWQEAADKGRKIAQYFVGTMNANLAKTGSEGKHLELAKHYLQQSADQGYLRAKFALQDLLEQI